MGERRREEKEVRGGIEEREKKGERRRGEGREKERGRREKERERERRGECTQQSVPHLRPQTLHQTSSSLPFSEGTHPALLGLLEEQAGHTSLGTTQHTPHTLPSTIHYQLSQSH